MRNKVSESDIHKLFYGILVEAVDELTKEFEEIEAYETCAKLKNISDKLKEKQDGIRIQSTVDTGGGKNI